MVVCFFFFILSPRDYNHICFVMKLDNSVAIISRLDYLHKMKHLISDTTKFKGLQNNTQLNPQPDSLSAYLRKLRNDKIIDDAIFYKILASG